MNAGAMQRDPAIDAYLANVSRRNRALMFPAMTCKCGKPARVRCFNGLGTFWVECEDGHGVGRPA
jgi:hypothetical protein